MLAKTLVVFYVWYPDKLYFLYRNPLSGIIYSIMSNKTLPYHVLLYNRNSRVGTHGMVWYGNVLFDIIKYAMPENRFG